jgi:hypothetical protein
MNLGALLIGLLFFAVVFWAARRLMKAYSIEEPIYTTIHVILVVLLVLWLAQGFGVWHGGPSFSFRG